jgi:hypothetical protein
MADAAPARSALESGSEFDAATIDACVIMPLFY